MVLRYPGGGVSSAKTSSDTDVVEAQFIDLVPNTKIVYSVNFVSDDPAYDSLMIMTWNVSAIDGRTRVEITADNVPDVISEEDHAAGMGSSLANLAEFLALQSGRR
jgi:uncharacterized protein YndB with AHSA1/START domain